MRFVRDFWKISKGDADLAGGKGASLGEMTKAGIPVPPGFVILASTFDTFLEQTDVNVEIAAVLKTVRPQEMHTVEFASEKIQSLILAAEIPTDIKKEILAGFKKLRTRFVAVRSSATAEDSANAAWAGQLESYLNTPLSNLLENVKKCWASLFTPRAIFYRFEKNLHNKKISVAVVIQKMVKSECSGIAFSVHPVTQDPNQLIIEAGFGLGEAIVSGQITPDSYVVEKEPRKILDKNIQIQSRGLYRSTKGGNAWREIPKELGERQVLTDNQIDELSNLILRIEKHYGFPCDIEWAYEKGRLYIVQSRPITTLQNRSDVKMTSERYFSVWVEENRNDYDFIPVLQNYSEYSEKKFGFGIREAMIAGKEFQAEFFLEQSEFDRLAKEGSKFFLELKGLKLLEKSIKGAGAQMQAEIRVLLSTDLSKLSNAELFEADRRYGSAISNFMACYAATEPFMVAGIEQVFLSQLEKEVPQASRFRVQSLLTQPCVEFHFSKQGKLLEKSFAELLGHEDAVIDQSLVQQKIYTAIKIPSKKRDDLLKKFSLSNKTLQLSRILREISEKRMRMRLDWMPSLYYFELFLIELKRRTGVSKSDLRAYSFLEYAELLKTGKRISSALIKQRRKAYLARLKNGTISTAEGKAAEEQLQKLTDFAIESTQEILGQCASPGIARGSVVVLSYKNSREHSRKISVMKEGDILVTEMTRPNIIMACQKAGAIVTDEGGITCHAAIIARELQKPCLIGTRFATRILRDGMDVEVDATNGVVKILEKYQEKDKKHHSHQPFSDPTKIERMVRQLSVFPEEETLEVTLLNWKGNSYRRNYGHWVKYVSTRSKNPREVLLYWDTRIEDKFLKEIEADLLKKKNYFHHLKKYFFQSYRNFQKKTDQIFATSQKDSHFFHKKTPRELIELFQQFNTAHRKALAAYYVAYDLANLLPRLVEKDMVKEYPKKKIEEIQELLRELSSLGISSFARRQEQDFLKTLLAIQKRYQKTRQRDDKIIQSLIQKHFYQFAVNESDEGVVPYQSIEKYFFSKIRWNVRKKMHDLKKEEREAQNRYRRLIQSLRKNPELYRHVLWMREAMRWRNADAENYHVSFFHAHPLFMAMAQRMNISLADLWLLSKKEIMSGLVKKNNVRHIVHQRKKHGFTIKQVGQRIKVSTGVSPADWHEETIEQSEKFSGTAVFPGECRGKAKIIFHPGREGHKITRHDILVTSMTTPNFVPLMKRARGIITDEGGLLCHAAIVARELKKPCVVGTRYATRLLHDGDEIILNANTGQIQVTREKV